MTTSTRTTLPATLCVLLSALSACNSGKREIPPEPTPQPINLRETVLRGTIGGEALYSNATPVLLRGFGVVVGLGENGSRDCPTSVREYLVDYFARQISSQATLENRRQFSPQRLIDSLNTAVVEVYGVVPVGAVKGTEFDLQVHAIGAQTRSLEGGLLLPCELKIYRPDAGGRGIVGGRTLAIGAGPVFTNPFREAADSSDDLRRGLVLGGGTTEENRPVRLLLNQPSYTRARAFERRINERFGQNPPTSDAVSRGYLVLNTPMEFAERPDRFLELVTHLPIEGGPVAIEEKLQSLSDDVRAEALTMERLSLVWEAIGRAAIASIQSLYEHPESVVRFYAARAGVRLGDVVALPVITQIALDANNPFRVAAIVELGDCGLPGAVQPLEQLLDDPVPDVRLAAYEGTLNYANRRITSRTYRHILDPRFASMTLDVIETTGPPLVYVHRTGAPRIAIFDAQMPVELPLFYAHSSDRVMLDAQEDQGEIQLLWQTRRGRRVAEPLRVPPRVAALVQALAQVPLPSLDGTVQGVGLSYATVLDVLEDLTNVGTIDAALVLEQPAIANVLGPGVRPGRPDTIGTETVPRDRPEADEVGLFPEDEPLDGDRPE